MLPAQYMRRAICTLILGLLATSACGGRMRAPTMPNGQRLALVLVLDRALDPQTPADKATQLQQVADYMEPDLLQRLRGAGYDAAVSSAEAAASGPGQYTLRVRIVDYRGGSKTARMFVGFGAGAARLDSHFELIGPGGQSYASGSPGATTSQTDWRRVVRKVNDEIVAAVNVRLRQGL